MKFEISKRTKNAIIARLNGAAKKYGISTVRMVASNWANKQREKARVEKEIAIKQRELQELQRKK